MRTTYEPGRRAGVLDAIFGTAARACTQGQPERGLARCFEHVGDTAQLPSRAVSESSVSVLENHLPMKPQILSLLGAGRFTELSLWRQNLSIRLRYPLRHQQAAFVVKRDQASVKKAMKIGNKT